MSTLNFWRLMIRFGLLLGLAGLMVIASQPDRPAHAENAARPLLQDGYPADPTQDTGYPAAPTETPDEGYPVNTPDTSPSNTPEPTATFAPGVTPQPTNTSPVITQPPFETPATQVVPPTPNLSATAELDPFRTEDAEMGGSQTGTPTTPTPGGTPSPTVSVTPTTDENMVGLAAIEPKEEESTGFEMNWGLFWIGFSIPVVGACGVVLYLLDRRPEFFRPKRK